MKEKLSRETEGEGLTGYRKLWRGKAELSRENQQKRIKVIESERKNEIKVKMPGLLKSGHIVYCRNFTISLTGRLCSSLECSYKDKKDNVVQGCTSCMKFHIGRRTELVF